MISRGFLWLAIFAAGEGRGAGEPAAIFSEYCASCHGLDGRARTPAGRKLGARSLVESTIPPAEVETQILEGVLDKKGQPRMPGFKDRLAPAEVAALVEYVRTFRR